MRRLQPAVAVAIVLAWSFLAGKASAVPITIDNFTDPGPAPPAGLATPGVTQTGVGSMSGSNSGLGGVLGGVRDFNLTVTAAAVPALDGANLEIAAGFIDFDATGAGDGEFTLTYDAGGMGLGADFSTQAGIQIDITLLTGVPTPVTLTLMDGSGPAAVASTSLTALGPQLLSFAFNGATFSNFGSLNLGNIESIGLFVNPPTAGELRIDTIDTFEVIPEPGSLALWGALAVAGVWYGRRLHGRRAAAA